MIFLFYLFNVIGLIYFVLKKRQFDFFSLAYFSELVYFMPGFFGKTSYQLGRASIESQILDGTYIVMCIFIAILLFFTLLYDSKKHIVSKSDYKKSYIGEILLIISLLMVYLLLNSDGILLLTLEKKDLMSEVSSSLLLMETTASLSFVVFFLEKKRVLLFLSLSVLILDLVIGFRFAFIISIVSILFIYLNSLGKFQLIVFWKFGISMIIIVFILIISKEFMYGLKFGFSDYSLQQFQTVDFYLNALKKSEPFTIVSILNEVIKNNFKTDFEQLFAILKLIPFSETIFNIQIIGFNDKFQHILFPYVSYGLANNIFAQIWSLGGYSGVFLFSIIYFYLLYLGNILMKNNFKPLITLIFSLQSFYIFRNDLLYQITLEKKYIISFLFAYFINVFIKNILKGKYLNAKTNIPN